MSDNVVTFWLMTMTCMFTLTKMGRNSWSSMVVFLFGVASHVLTYLAIVKGW